MDTLTNVCTVEGCGKQFKRRDRLDIHIRTHTGERPYVCHYAGCAKSYARQQHLSRHIDRSHTPSHKDQSRVRCPHCNLDLANTLCLKKHMQSFHDATDCRRSFRYKCTESDCNESFHKKKQLVVHKLRCHTDHLGKARKCYHCPHESCGKSFTFPNRLKHHMKTHQGYACDAEGCSHISPNWSSLRKHRATDHAPAHTCSICRAVFKQKSSWKQHLKTHSSTRDLLTCPRENCGRQYLYKKNLTQHIREFHDQEVIWKNRQRKPLKRHHKNNTVSRKKSMAGRLCGFDDRSDAIQERLVDPSLVSDVLQNSMDISSGYNKNSLDISSGYNKPDADCISGNKCIIFDSCIDMTDIHNTSKTVSNLESSNFLPSPQVSKTVQFQSFCKVREEVLDCEKIQ